MKDVLDLVQSYFDLMYTGDVSNFDRVFHENAQLQTVGKTLALDKQQLVA